MYVTNKETHFKETEISLIQFPMFSVLASTQKRSGLAAKREFSIFLFIVFMISKHTNCKPATRETLVALFDKDRQELKWFMARNWCN